MPVFTSRSSNSLPARIVADHQAALESFDCDGALAFISNLADLDNGDIMRRLHAVLPCPVVGGTTVSSPFDDKNSVTSSALTVLKKPGVRFATAHSEALDASRGQAQMERLIEATQEKLGGKADLFLINPPFFPDWNEESFLPHFYHLAGDTPVFGGSASDHPGEGLARTIHNDLVSPDRLVVTAFAGDIRPVFSQGIGPTVINSYAPTVTKGSGRVVHRVDDMSMVSYLRDQRLDVDNPALLEAIPILTRVEGEWPGFGHRVNINQLIKLDLQTGSGIFARGIPAGARISLYGTDSDGIGKSAHAAIADIVQHMRAVEASGYRYDLLFCISCLGRFFYSYGSDSIENELIMAEKPEGLPVHGYYGYNEICPELNEERKLHNSTHGMSICLCAF